MASDVVTVCQNDDSDIRRSGNGLKQQHILITHSTTCTWGDSHVSLSVMAAVLVVLMRCSNVLTRNNIVKIRRHVVGMPKMSWNAEIWNFLRQFIYFQTVFLTDAQFHTQQFSSTALFTTLRRCHMCTSNMATVTDVNRLLSPHSLQPVTLSGSPRSIFSTTVFLFMLTKTAVSDSYSYDAVSQNCFVAVTSFYSLTFATTDNLSVALQLLISANEFRAELATVAERRRTAVACNWLKPAVMRMHAVDVHVRLDSISDWLRLHWRTGWE